ncbi:hypothetical protein UFOVP636_36 [uncultured Caudovirales phage]|uniref:Uncharacterized protein n=1 Tax=uncultured Caudovirales phage TaxID=2100421 RepID=A0A6J5N9U1_9CAUD|nr:hypothetical protein UFOVP636_36 [uncultured Caudovirales phage]
MKTTESVFINEATERTIKMETSITGKQIRLITITHNVFGDCYYIFVDGIQQHLQYGTSKLDAIFNEFVTEDFNLVWSH